MRVLFLIMLLHLMAVPFAEAYRHALIVGQNRGGTTVEDLRYAESDAKRISAMLRIYAGFETENISLLLSPDSISLMRAGKELVVKIASDTDPGNILLFFFYSGHADEKGLLLDSTHFAFTAIKDLLDGSGAGIRIAIFDACQSGVVVAFKGGRRAEPFFITSQKKMKGEVWIASSSADERAQESESLKSSLFSFHLINGLRGSADVSSDNKVTVNEAYQYAYRKTIETSALTSGIIQHPVYRFNISGEGDIVLTDLSGRKGGITVDGTCSGSFLVLSSNYTEVYADFYKDAERETFIGLASGDYTIINAKGGTDIGLYRFTIKGTEAIRCSSGMFRASLLQEARLKGPEPVPSDSDTAVVGEEKKGRRFRIGPGIGPVFRKEAFSTEWDGMMSLSLQGTCVLSGTLNCWGTLDGIPQEKTAGLCLGLEREGMLAKGSNFLGFGAGVEYAREYGSSADGVLSPLLQVHAGAGIFVSPRMYLGFIMPFRMIFRDGTAQTIGLQARILFPAGQWMGAPEK